MMVLGKHSTWWRVVGEIREVSKSLTERGLGFFTWKK